MLSSGDKQTHSLCSLFCTEVFSFIGENLFIPELEKSWKVLFRETVEENLQRSKVPGYGCYPFSGLLESLVC